MTLRLTTSTLGFMLLLCCFHGIEHGCVTEPAIAAGPLGCAQSSACFFLPLVWIFHHIFTACTAIRDILPTVCGVRLPWIGYNDSQLATCSMPGPWKVC